MHKINYTINTAQIVAYTNMLAACKDLIESTQQLIKQVENMPNNDDLMALCFNIKNHIKNYDYQHDQLLDLSADFIDEKHNIINKKLF
jgi:hypothetical protein